EGENVAPVVVNDQGFSPKQRRFRARLPLALCARALRGIRRGSLVKPPALIGPSLFRAPRLVGVDDPAVQREEERELAPAEVTLNANLPTQEARQLTADREAEPGAAKLVTGLMFDLLKCFEDDLLLVYRYADTRVHH